MQLKRKEFLGYTAPSMIVMGLLMVAPLILTIYLSFHNYTFGTTAEFVGLKNYIDTFKDQRFWDSTKFSIVLTVVTTIIKITIGFSIALLLYHATKFRSIFITGTLLPFIVPPVVATLIFGWLFRSNTGYISYLLDKLGVGINWYADPLAAKWLIMIHYVWQGVPFVLLVLYAGLQSMPKEPLEAAFVDGASFLQRVFYVIIPQLSPLFVFVAMMQIMDAYRLFDSVAVMTKGGPGNATESLMYYNYDIAFGRLNLGMGSAISVLTLIGIVVLLGPFLYKTYKEQIEG